MRILFLYLAAGHVNRPTIVTCDCQSMDMKNGKRTGDEAWLAFDSACQHASHEVALQREEHNHRQQHRQERRGSEHLPTRAQGCDHIADLVSHERRGAAEEYQCNQQVIPDTQEL